MEMTMRNLATAAAKVQASRILDLLLSIKRGTAQMDTKTAISGFMEVIVSMKSDLK
jgi:hypothetical protein